MQIETFRKRLLENLQRKQPTLLIDSEMITIILKSWHCNFVSSTEQRLYSVEQSDSMLTYVEVHQAPPPSSL